MDRDAIERRDFPVGRRGYEQEAVDEHLRRVADEMERLRDRPAAAPAPSLAAGASQQVRLILEAAETSAAELRADAGREASDHVAKVQQASATMLARLDELERELGTLLADLRASGERLSEGLARLHERAGAVGASVAPPAGAGAPAPRDDAVDAGAAARPPAEVVDAGAAARPPAEVVDAGAAARPPAEVVDAGAAAPTTDEVVDARMPVSPSADDTAVSPAADAGAPPDDVVDAGAPISEPAADLAPTDTADNGAPHADEAGARLIALNMALSGTPRDETARYLAEHFELADPEALLDDVYDRAER